MKRLLYLFLAVSLFACSDDSDPDPLTAQVVIHQRANMQSVWYSALVTQGEDINSAQMFQTSGFHEEIATPVEPNQPFALILDLDEYGGHLNILMKVSHSDTKLITIEDTLFMREVYIHPNGNMSAAQEFANSIDFPANILILE